MILTIKSENIKPGLSISDCVLWVFLLCMLQLWLSAISAPQFFYDTGSPINSKIFFSHTMPNAELLTQAKPLLTPVGDMFEQGLQHLSHSMCSNHSLIFSFSIVIKGRKWFSWSILHFFGWGESIGKCRWLEDN